MLTRFLLRKLFIIQQIFKKNGTNLEIQKHFILGKSYKTQNPPARLSLPLNAPFNILKSDSHSVIRKFGLAEVFDHNKCNTFYFRISNDYSIILLTEQAEPWLKIKMESLQKALISFSCNYEPK